MRRLMATTLRQLGLEVLVAATGAEALDIAASREAGIDVLVTDVVMPGMQGHTVATRLRELHPAVASSSSLATPKRPSA